MVVVVVVGVVVVVVAAIVVVVVVIVIVVIVEVVVVMVGSSRWKQLEIYNSIFLYLYMTGGILGPFEDDGEGSCGYRTA